MTNYIPPNHTPPHVENLRVEKQVQQSLPFGLLVPRRVLPLAAEHIRPVVRIAHRVHDPLLIAERILFDHEFVLILAGSGELVWNGQRCLYQPHDLLFLPPFQPHCFDAPQGHQGEHIAVHFDFAPSLAGLDDELPQRAPYEVRLAPALYIPPRQFAPPGGPLEQAFLNLVGEQNSTDPLASLRTTREMLSVLAQAITAAQSDRFFSIPAAHAKQQARVARVLNFIHSRLHSPLDAAQLAQAADMSVSRLNTVFREATGYSPLEFVRRARVAQARRLLADPELPVKEIAARCGFEDAFHFSRVFRQVDGLSPTQYRAALLASQPKALTFTGETDNT